ncbi:MAG: methylhydantoinase [Chloroflexota bacterium]
MVEAGFRTDPVTVEVIGNALLSIAEEMGEALVRAAYSDNIKERRDSSTAIFDPAGQTLAQAAHIPIHLGSFLGVVEAVLRRFPVSELRDGDMFIGNDPYAAGGTHLPDIVLTAPVFFEGRLVGFVTNLGHHADFFDRGEGRHIWQEGLRIPALRLVEAGRIREDLLELILLNCQLPRDRLGDLRAQIAANRLGIRRLRELCTRHGLETVLRAEQDLLDYTERRMRAALKVIPEGVYPFEDELDSNYLTEPIRLVLTVTRDREGIILDFSGCPPQGPHPFNMNLTATLATCYYALKTLVDPEIPPNAGLYRPIRVVAPAGTVVNCIEPAAVEARTQTCQRVVDLIYGALAPAIPDRVTAAHNGGNSSVSFHGIHPRTGRPFRYMETLGGGFGARGNKDGLDGVQVHVTNTSNLPIEALEHTYPLLVSRYELITDSGGPGRWRGGMGFVREIRVVEGEVFAGANITRIRSRPWGLFGGLPGAPQRAEVVRANGSVEPLPPGPEGRARIRLGPGDGLALITSGGGGYGDPKTRERWRVLQDLREGRISVRAAVEDYGLDPREIPAEVSDDNGNG